MDEIIISPTRLSRLLFFLFCLFCVAYPIAVIGVTFNVNPPFSMVWAGSALLILEGTMMAIAVMDEYAILGLFAIILTAILAYAIEALGVNTGFPFGAYHYTNALAPILPGGVPLAMIFAWILIIFSVQGVIYGLTPRVNHPLARIILRSVLAILLILLLEPVAFHIEHYWNWVSPGSINYYGVPISNFIAWFVISFLLLMLVNGPIHSAMAFADLTSFAGRLPTRMAALLYTANVVMLGLIDLTHGYYWSVALAVFAVLLLLIISPLPRYSELAKSVVDSIEQEQAYQDYRKRARKTKRKKRRKPSS